MKPLKGELDTVFCGYGSWKWTIYVTGNIMVCSLDSYSSRKGATRSARNYAKRLGIELEPSK